MYNLYLGLYFKVKVFLKEFEDLMIDVFILFKDVVGRKFYFCMMFVRVGWILRSL